MLFIFMAESEINAHPNCKSMLNFNHKPAHGVIIKINAQQQ